MRSVATQRRKAAVGRLVGALLSGGVCALALAAGFVASASSASGEPSGQSDYPVLSAPPMAVTLPTTLTDQVRLSSLIVDATVKRVLPAEPRVINIVPGSAEAQINAKTGGSETTAAFGEIEFTVNEVLKGDAGESLVMDISPLADGCAPEFTPGDRFVLFLFQNDEGHLFSVALQDAYWYVAKDARVYPAVVTDQLKTYSGKGLGPFKSAINAIKRELK